MNAVHSRTDEADDVIHTHTELNHHEIAIANGLFIQNAPAEYRLPWNVGEMSVQAKASPRHAQLSNATDADIHLLVDGIRIDPELGDGVAGFLIPEWAREVRLISETFIPAEWSDSGDSRRLGISIHGLHINDGRHCNREISINDSRLGEGFHYLETENGTSWRWTNGSLRLPRELWADCSSHIFLRVTMDPGGRPYWVALSNDKAQRAA
ncbi:hypothetical protein HB779_09115 [Phyllobacterium sp. 628]|uniref:hypothetical protein n=1 Tax=Phyllobacterium sp. 628 TaxID=2718938 RepID=UPI0016622365|nr:hypothetical protein [Phyllobacterium sp. 628]QND52050.1 hypothetical protein HB779_09115 [Phyllobacterium sp. 628]